MTPYLSQMKREFHSSLHPDDGIPVTDDETVLVILLLHPDDGIHVADDETVLVIPLLHPDYGIPVTDDETIIVTTS
jgi:hypothetical protein